MPSSALSPTRTDLRTPRPDARRAAARRPHHRERLTEAVSIALSEEACSL